MSIFVGQCISTYSLKRLLCILLMIAALCGPVTLPAIGLCMPELRGLPDRGDMLMGDVWLMGDMSALTGVPKLNSKLDALELRAEIVLPAAIKHNVHGFYTMPNIFHKNIICLHQSYTIC